MAIISLSGKINSGKDTVGEIIQIITNSPHFTDEAVLSFIGKPHLSPKWEIRKFADKTTKAFYIITGINYHILNREEKEKIRPTYIKFAEGQKDLFENDAIWVNALMSEYVSQFNWNDSGRKGLPNWLITDTRFENELKAVEDKKGITIRVNRKSFKWIDPDEYEIQTGKKVERIVEHESEKALDNAEFDYVIQNDGTLEDLIQKVREILILEKII